MELPAGEEGRAGSTRTVTVTAPIRHPEGTMTVTAASSPAPRVTWRAGSDLVAHAHLPHAIRTLCDMRVLDVRFAWPTHHRKCLVCLAAVEQGLEAEQIPETELRLLHGDR